MFCRTIYSPSYSPQGPFRNVGHASHHLFQILVDVADDARGCDVHPLLVTTLEKNTSLMFARTEAFVKFAVQQFRDLEATTGWQFVTVHLYDFEGAHLVDWFTRFTCVIAVPDSVLYKVPNYVAYTQKALKCNIPLSLVGWVLCELNIVPRAESGCCVCPPCLIPLHCWPCA